MMGRVSEEPPPPSPLAEAVGRVGDRWALLIVHALLAGPKRFGDLQDDLPAIAPNVLTQRLRHLEREGVVVGEPYSRRPPRVVYRLTAAGQELAGALRLLAQWGAGRAEAAAADAHGAEPLRHPACGTALEARWWCPTCDRVVDDPDADDLRFV
jgi:DNA-binding HxlR family transcriptional regulator